MRALSSHRLVAYAYALLTTVVVLLFAFAEWWTGKFVSDRARAVSTAIEVGIVLLAALVFRPIHVRVEAAVDAAFTKRRRQALAALANFTRELTSFNDTAQLLRRVVEALNHHTESAGCAIYLRRQIYRAEASSFETPAENVELDDPLAVRLRSSAAPARPVLLRSAACGTVAFPLTVAGDLIGFVCVSAKHGDYEADELQAIAVLSEALALALVELDPDLRSVKVGVPNNLPADLPPLIGRGEEVAEIKALLDASRLVTLTGAGGVGKTRVALYVASEMHHNSDGIWFVDLAPIQDAELVASAIANVLGVADEGGERRLIDHVAGVVRSKHLLIVLDNCEHVVSKAAEAVEYLLQTCPAVQILATSREPLGLQAEEPYRMPSLKVADGIALFVARARSAERSFTLTDENSAAVEEIVRRLDGIPMAIELAAPRVKVLGVHQIAQRLDERLKLLTGGSRTALPRHQTLHALIRWSYDLLHEPEKRLLRHAAVFRGDWTLEAAEAICAGDGSENSNAVELLEALVDKSLVTVRVDGELRRYRLLESTRQFAMEQLDAAGERVAASSRHAHYYATLAERAGAAYWQTDSDTWIAQVRDELENFRAAIAFGLSHEGDGARAAAIIADLRWLWYTTARREGHALCLRAADVSHTFPQRTQGLLALTSAVLDPSAKATAPAAHAAGLLAGGVDELGHIEALTLEGTSLGRAGRIKESCARLTQALEAARGMYVPRLTGWVLSTLAYWFGAAGDSVAARGFFDEAADVLRSCEDPWQLARLQLHRAEFLFVQGDLEQALAGAREAERVFRERGAETGLCISVLNATAYLLALGRLDEAWASAREGLELAQGLGNAMACAWGIGHLAELAAQSGDVVRAARLLGRADAVYDATGSAREPTEQRGYDRALELVKAALPEERIAILMAEGAMSATEAAVNEGLLVCRPSPA